MSRRTTTPPPPPPLPRTEDPHILLNLDPMTTNASEIKRAYKRMAMKYHPDVVLNSQSTAEDKKRANDDFARINAAYESLRSGGKKTVKEQKKQEQQGYTPPHRRTTARSYSSSSYSSSTSSGAGAGASTDWKDYMPKDDDEEYDTGGDSFGAIFSDLFSGAGAAAAAGAGGTATIFRDFIEFLEGNVDGFTTSTSSTFDNDPKLQDLLRNGSTQDIEMEMDDVELLSEQLRSKLVNIENELVMLEAELKVNADVLRYVDRLEKEERLMEVKARKDVVLNYKKKADRRLVRLRERRKELIVEGRYDRDAGGSTTTTRETTTATTTTTSTRAQVDDDSSTKQQTASNTARREGFGSFGRRGSSRRSRRGGAGGTTQQPSTSSSPRSTTTSNSNGGSSSRTQNKRYSSSSSSSTSSSQQQQQPQTTNSSHYFKPPHRRSSSSSVEQDKRRLRELKIDEEFDQLKKDLGL